MKITLVNGIISDVGSCYYSDTSVWIDSPKPNKNALIIRKTKPNVFRVANAIIEKVISRSDYTDEAEYISLCSFMHGKHDIVCEFITENDTYCVGLRETGMALNDVTEIDYDHCSYY